MVAIENEALVEAFMKSNKTLDEAIDFFKTDIKEELPAKKRCGGRRKQAYEKNERAFEGNFLGS